MGGEGVLEMGVVEEEGVHQVGGDLFFIAKLAEEGSGFFGGVEGAAALDDVAAEDLVVVAHAVAAGDLGGGDEGVDVSLGEAFVDGVFGALEVRAEGVKDAVAESEGQAIDGEIFDGVFVGVGEIAGVDVGEGVVEWLVPFGATFIGVVAGPSHFVGEDVVAIGLVADGFENFAETGGAEIGAVHEVFPLLLGPGFFVGLRHGSYDRGRGGRRQFDFRAVRWVWASGRRCVRKSGVL